jgi:hypothetical protein
MAMEIEKELHPAQLRKPAMGCKDGHAATEVTNVQRGLEATLFRDDRRKNRRRACGGYLLNWSSDGFA